MSERERTPFEVVTGHGTVGFRIPRMEDGSTPAVMTFGTPENLARVTMALTRAGSQVYGEAFSQALSVELLRDVRSFLAATEEAPPKVKA